MRCLIAYSALNESNPQNIESIFCCQFLFDGRTKLQSKMKFISIKMHTLQILVLIPFENGLVSVDIAMHKIIREKDAVE